MFAETFKDRRVLITGHTGFKGTWLTEWLLQLGSKVVGYSIDIPTSPSGFEILKQSARIKHVQGDILDLNHLKKVTREFRPDILFHLAAQSLVRPSYNHPKYTFDVNFGGTVNVMEAIRSNPSIRAAVLVSTDKCYKNRNWEWGYRENDSLGGDDPYSTSKACMELAIQSYFKSYFSAKKSQLISSVRAGNVIGGGDWAKDRIVPDCVRQWSKNGIPLLRSPHSIRPWQHVLEPLSGYLQIAAVLYQEAKKQNPSELFHGEAFNFGPHPSQSRSVIELVDELRTHWGKKVSYTVSKKIEAVKKEQSILKLTCEKARDRLYWEPTLNFRETVEMTSRWYKEYYERRTDMTKFTQSQIHFFSCLAKQRNSIGET